MGYLFEQLAVLFSAIILFISGVSAPPDLKPAIFSQSTTTATVVAVIDGDTIEVKLDGEQNPVRIRYIGIDTPEPYAEGLPECGSLAASDRNKELVAGKVVSFIPGAQTHDKYNRLLAYVYVDNIFVNELLVREGFATVLMIKPNATFETSFRTLYKTATIEKKGIWATCPIKN